jgi:mRNA interferase RelE/StbE
MPNIEKGTSLTEYIYRIFETNEYLKRVSKFDKQNFDFIQNKLASYVYPQLKSEPHFGNNIKKLAGYKPETWRYRIGKYRLFYSVNEQAKIVFILTVEFRKDAY